MDLWLLLLVDDTDDDTDEPTGEVHQLNFVWAILGLGACLPCPALPCPAVTLSGLEVTYRVCRSISVWLEE